MIRWMDIFIQTPDNTPRGSFVVSAEFERAEELRPDRLGPSEDMLDGWEPDERPSTTLGPMG